MSPLVLRLFAPAILLFISVLLYRRLKSIAGDRKPLISNQLWVGFVLLMISTTWYAVMGSAVYATWFVPRAYILFDIIALSIGCAGAILSVLGVADIVRSTHDESESFRNQHKGLGILSGIQRAAKQPFSVTELMSVTLEEVRLGIPGMCGAIYLYNRARRELVLTVSHGLKRDESAYLERLTSETNPLFQALTIEELLIGGELTFVGADGEETISRFKSTLAIPLVSGQEKLGGVILFSEQDRAFDKGTVGALEPVCGWLAERIRVTRLTRETKQVAGSAQSIREQHEFTLDRVTALANAISTDNAAENFCRSLKGIAGADSAYLIGLSAGTLTIHGGSEIAEEFSENYRSALINAFDRSKPLIINQEGTSSDGDARVVLSSLVYPIKSPNRREAILLRKKDSPISIGDSELRILHMAALIGSAVAVQGEQERLLLARKRGFEKVISFLRWESQGELTSDPRYFERQLAEIMPAHSILATFVRDGDLFRLAPDSSRGVTELIAAPNDGVLGRAIASGEYCSISGTTAVSRAIQSLSSGLRDNFGRLFGQRGTPSLLCFCPLTSDSGVVAVTVAALHEIGESEALEWERLLTLSVALYRLSQTMAHLKQREHESALAPVAINEINNRLTAVIGKAELLLANHPESVHIRLSLKEIITEAQAAAESIRKKGNSEERPGHLNSSEATTSLNSAINDTLKSARISDGLFMIGGRPREIEVHLGPEAALSIIDIAARQLAGDLVSRISSASDDEDIITIRSYQRDQYVYFDFTRHRRHQSAMEPIANVGQYSPAADVMKYRPEDAYLGVASKTEAQVAFDRQSRQPAYLSLRFPVQKSAAFPAPAKGPRVLAIDDQPVILDLITAMCQSMGFEVVTAISGEEGMKLAMTQHFDAVMTDLSMPGMTGLEVARALKSSRPNLPVILVTGWDTGMNQNELASAGVSDVVYKPFRIEQLTAVLRTVTSRIIHR